MLAINCWVPQFIILLHTVFWLSLLVFILFFCCQGFDFSQADGVVDGVADASEGDEEEGSSA